MGRQPACGGLRAYSRGHLNGPWLLDGDEMVQKRLPLDEMQFFVAVVEHGGFTAAGEALTVPKSTVSRKVAALEDILGVRLLNRTTRSLQLTDAGRLLHRRGADALASLDEAALALQELQAEATGTLRISAPIEFSALVGGGLMGRFLDAHPKVNVELVLENRMVDLVAEGYDLAFRATNNPLPDSSLVARRLGASNLQLVASPSYIEAHGMPERPAALREHTVVAHGPTLGPRRWELRSESSTEDVDVRPRVVVNSFQTIKEAVVAGFGIGVLSNASAAAALQRGELVHVLPAWRFARGSVYLVYPSARYITARVRAFIDFTMNEAAMGTLRGISDT